jgi:hypothetical protein
MKFQWNFDRSWRGLGEHFGRASLHLPNRTAALRGTPRGSREREPSQVPRGRDTVAMLGDFGFQKFAAMRIEPQQGAS